MPAKAKYLVPGVLIFLLPGFQAPNAWGVTQNRLEDLTSLRCNFPVYATGTWENGESKAEVKDAKLSVAFDSIDTQDGTAQAIGAFGPVHIVVRFSAGNLHFMQIGTAGNLYVTTVFSKETRAGKRQAVHSRHEYTPVSLPGYTSRPEQYYGECEAGK